MKESIHPKWYPNAKVIVEGEVVMTVGSTKPELSIEVWSGSHPFYTGTQRLMDTEGQVDRFMRRLQKREEIQTQTETVKQSRNPENFSVEEMELGTRANSALAQAGLTTVGDVLALLKKGDDEILALQGIGQTALIKIKRYMRDEALID
ncbi:MAG: 50S ribosomal protein L31 [Candidatus Promineofilum sp.]|nr:50S ribosomal protein L31 [Promineifilum sp.]MBP9657247.1 50S ribosomal protein L31 [Promineifilum sp.]